ncbi:uncharacterized protein LOC116265985 isoform X2 [Nymphaea colorata]|uniref:uncharacterized protein LOC116265985 isoform X2 n=1 Tax=Nymphaea colorata TaxID=210225 RepID=UPI00129DF241|nr:uncharacterized protein LOC116265985 isoform X2 [Nymphaea colorata]
MKKQLKESHKFQLPKCCQQPRSGGTKPRTDFTESVWSSSGSDLESLICNQSMPTAMTTGISQEIYRLALGYDKKMHKTFPIHCVSVDEGHRVPFAISLDSRAELSPVSREKFVDVDTIGLQLQDQGDPCADFSSEKFVSTPINKSHGTDSKNTRESVAWAKLTEDGGWPAEALNKNETVNSSLDGDKTRCMPTTPIQVHEYSVVASRDASCSSRSEDSDHDKGRGKRKRKRKVHFDETTPPAKSMKASRRLKIMRQLGLIPPPGSSYAH